MKMRRFISALMAMVLLFLLTACGASAPLSAAGGEYGAKENYYSVEEDYTQAVADSLSSPNASGEVAPVTNQKLIRTVKLEAETEDMDALLADVESRIASLGGYVENRNVYNGGAGSRRSRNATMVVRIPADKLDGFVQQVSGVSNIVSHSENTRDVTLSYVATESRVTALQTEEARLLELLAEAKDLKDLLTLEEKLTDVRTELEQHKSQLKVYDNLVSYATVNLSVTEVVEYTVVEEPKPAPTFWQRLGGGFVESIKGVWTICKEVVIWLVCALPYLVLPGVIVAAILIPRAVRRRKAKKQAPPEAMQ
jgi:DNA-binding transcriptional regulator GbsR (MarR family)